MFLNKQIGRSDPVLFFFFQNSKVRSFPRRLQAYLNQHNNVVVILSMTYFDLYRNKIFE